MDKSHSYSCSCVSCVSLTPKVDKFGKQSMPLTSIRQQIRMDLCQNTAKFKASSIVRTHQSSVDIRVHFETKFSMKIKSKVQTKIEPKFEQKIQPKPSPARNFTSFTTNSKAIGLTRKTVTKTPITKFQPKKFNPSVPTLGLKSSKPNTKNQMANESNLIKVAPAISKNINEIENAEKCDIDCNIDSNTVLEVVAEKSSVTKEVNQPSPIALKENLQQKASELQSEDETAQIKDDDIKTTSSQLKWIAEVLKLLNTGSEMDISEQLATIGPKTATLITRRRKFHGEFEQIDDLQKKLGWSDKVYQKFLLKNFL